LAHELGFESRPGCGAFHLPATPNGRGVAEAWAAAADADEAEVPHIKLLVVSGDDAAADESVRALAEQADSVLVVTMFQGLATGWADLIIPATGALERDGTTMNLEGRVQRQRRAVPPPCPDELAWLAKLAARFSVELAPHAAGVFEELAGRIYQDLTLEELGATAPLPARHVYEPPAEPTSPAPTPLPEPAARSEGTLHLQRYRPLFSGPAVERVPELEFQRPEPEVKLAKSDAELLGIATGDAVLLRSNGTSLELRARVSRSLLEGVARVAEEHAGDLHPSIEVSRA
jgi:predicted molibdopterin-dependent oxidoreductase YjgC